MSRHEPQDPQVSSPARLSRRSGEATLPGLTLRQQALVRRCCARIRAAGRWQEGLPVLLLERCWLRLSVVAIQELAQRLPPDCSREAPELVRYRELLAGGLGPLQAEQLCWQDFGMEACREAQQRFWLHQERGNHGWTLDRYLALLREYRQRLENHSARPLPLLVLARQGESARRSQHDLFWVGPETVGGERPMRHTCP